MGNPISALSSLATLQANASSNIANINTKGYRPIETTLTSSPTGEVSAITDRDTKSEVDLPGEFVDMMRAETGYKAVLEAIESREETINDLMELFRDRDDF